MADIRIYVTELDETGGRPIASRRQVTELLDKRRHDIQEAIAAASRLLGEAADRTPERSKEGWRLDHVEATFGLTLTAEAGVILSRASAEASFEVTVAFTRDEINTIR